MGWLDDAWDAVTDTGGGFTGSFIDLVNEALEAAEDVTEAVEDTVGDVADTGEDAEPEASEFAFDRYGVRVPALVISPWVEKGVVSNVRHDHTSVIRTVCERFGLRHLTERDRLASSLAGVFTRVEARTDAPMAL